jgi:hypothetical protein
VADRTPEQAVEARDYTYVSAYYRDDVPVDRLHPLGWKGRFENFIVLSPSVRVARPVALAHCVEHWGAEPLELYLQPRNYIDDARMMVRSGRFVAVDR